MKTLQWSPDGNPMNAIPLEVQLLIAKDSIVQGYGYGDGISLIFYHPDGDITLLPEQWVVLHDDGTVTVENSRPEGAEIFDAHERLRELQNKQNN